MTSIYISSVVRAPASEIWRAIRDFNALPDWHPLITESRIEAGMASDQVGCVRAFQLADGGRLREQLLALSDFDYSVTYSVLESPMRMRNYIATLKVTPITENDSSFLEWEAEFDCAPEDEAELVQGIGQGVFASGFAALQERFQ